MLGEAIHFVLVAFLYFSNSEKFHLDCPVGLLVIDFGWLKETSVVLCNRKTGRTKVSLINRMWQ